jgi:hypothetical protein
MAKVTKRSGSPKWQAEVWVWAGNRRKRIWKSTGIVDDGTAKSRQTAETVAREIERSFAVAGETALRPRKTLIQALEALTEAAELAQRTKHTLDNIMYRGVRLSEFFGNDKPLADITQDDLVKYATWSRKQRSAYTVHRELVVLWAAFEAVGEKRPVFPDLGDYRDHKPQRVLQVDEQRAFLLAVPPERRLNVMAYLRCGLRLSEPWKVVEMDWANRVMSVQATKRAKDRKAPRRVPVPDDCFELMYERRMQRDEPIPADGVEKITEENPVFPPWHRQPTDFVIRRASRRALNGEAISVNDLRGTWITMMALAGEQPISLAKMAGNSVKMLEDVYAQVEKMNNSLHRASSKLPRLTAPRPRVVHKNTNEGQS